MVQVPDGYEWDEETVTEQVAEGTYTCSCGQRRLGNGYFEDRACTGTRYGTRTDTATRKRVYRRAPVRRPWYVYRIVRFVPTDTFVVRSSDRIPDWPVTPADTAGTRSRAGAGARSRSATRASTAAGEAASTSIRRCGYASRRERAAPWIRAAARSSPSTASPPASAGAATASRAPGRSRLHAPARGTRVPSRHDHIDSRASVPGPTPTTKPSPERVGRGLRPSSFHRWISLDPRSPPLPPARPATAPARRRPAPARHPPPKIPAMNPMRTDSPRARTPAPSPSAWRRAG